MNENTLLMGYAKEKLTPSRDVFLGGYIDQDSEQNLCRYPQDVLSDIYVTAVCFDQGGTRAVLVCIDNCLNTEESTPAGFFQAIADAAGTSLSNVLITNTHNHQSLKYLQEPEVDIILAAVRVAVRDLRPVTMEWKSLRSDIGVNRRPKYIVAPHLPYDNSLNVLRLRSEGRKDLLILNYQMHNTALGVGRLETNAHFMCSELMGACSEQLEKEMDCTVYFANGFYGAAGPNIDGHFSADYPRILEAGQQLGKTVAASLEPMQGFTAGSLQTYRTEHTLPVNPVYGPDASEQLTIRVVSLGGLAFLGVDCEPFSEIGAWLKAYSPFPHTILLGNTNGFSGYIPTDEAFDAGSEERECRLNKTPYTKGISQRFRTLCLQALCDAAGKDVQEVFRVELQSVGGGLYEASVPENYVNRLVLDFGFLSRDNCPADFILQAGTALQTVWDNSISFVPVPLEKQRLSRICVQVTRTYQNVNDIDQLNITACGLCIQPNEKE